MHDAPAKIYQIAKWRQTFETADSRRHKVLTWVSVPNNLGSNGYVELINHFGQDESPAIYGAWIALSLIASQCPVRGVLCTSKPAPYTVKRLAFLSHFSSTVFERLLPWAESVGWLEVLTVEQANRLLTSGQTIDDHSPIALPHQTTPHLTQPDPTQPDTTAPIDRSLVAGKSSQENFSNAVENRYQPNFTWQWADVVRESERFRKISKVTIHTLPTDDLVRLIAFGLSLDRNFLADVADLIRNPPGGKTITSHRRYCEGAIRKWCRDRGLSHVDLIAQINRRVVHLRQTDTVPV